MANHVFNTCLMHARNVHQWAPTPETGRYTRCGHPSLSGPRPETMIEGSKAFTKFRDEILNHRLQEDLVKASPYGGTSICETKNALDRIYCRKEIYYPISTYPFYAKMATMHFNTLRLAEIAGERKPEREITIKRKYLSRSSKMVFKTPVVQHWRTEVFEEVLKIRRNMLQKGTEEQPYHDELEESTAAIISAEDAFDSISNHTSFVEEMRPELLEAVDMDALEEPGWSDVNAPIYIAQAILQSNSSQKDQF
ncbi:hypothetical protein OESDEN_16956 [Oesophagostomum dentatum]|uniref:Uncharacterized protein n=1 Tax=Oesophagostomum dentatum TaxID=61180 RepID=A0A0B1SIH8_OESDE|nr:hypothetical protein OESDEN_16956 [Oesophagostomum dentatum]